jgi:penicillin-binding protein 2
MDVETLRTDARFLGIGEGEIDTTPLQMANAYATLLGGGRHVTPRILAGTPPQVTQAFTLPRGVLEVIKDSMRKTVTQGTAKETFRDIKLPVAGKTGTADVSNKPVLDENGEHMVDLNRPLKNRDKTPALGPNGEQLYAKMYEPGAHSWFVGYAPADNPKFVIVAFKEFAGYGGKYAGPLVREAVLQLQRRNYLPAVDVK